MYVHKGKPGNSSWKGNGWRQKIKDGNPPAWDSFKGTISRVLMDYRVIKIDKKFPRNMSKRHQDSLYKTAEKSV